MIHKYVIIVAGGKGLRMGSDIPKQFIPVGGKPVLMRTIQAFANYDAAMHIIVVLPIEQQAYWKQLCEEYQFEIPHQIANGGATRFHSVKNGLQLVTEVGYVAVHDGVRPFVSSEVIARCFDEALQYKAVIPVTDVIETLRHTDGESSTTVPRSQYCLVQTPQVFYTQLLHSAYALPYSDRFTDDASVVEALGFGIHLSAGNRENIKLTTPFDLQIAEVLCTDD